MKKGLAITLLIILSPILLLLGGIVVTLLCGELSLIAMVLGDLFWVIIAIIAAVIIINVIKKNR